MVTSDSRKSPSLGLPNQQPICFNFLAIFDFFCFSFFINSPYSNGELEAPFFLNFFHIVHVIYYQYYYYHAPCLSKPFFLLVIVVLVVVEEEQQETMKRRGVIWGQKEILFIFILLYFRYVNLLV